MDTAISPRKMRDYGVPASEGEIACGRVVWPSTQSHAESCDSCRSGEMIPVPGRTVKRKLGDLELGYMLLTNQPGVAQSVRNVSMLKSVRPVDWRTVHAFCAAADNDARAIATVVEICGESG